VGKFWSNNKAGQPKNFPNQIVYECFECDEAFIGEIEFCPRCKNKLWQLYPFHGVGVQECLISSKTR